ncbi:MAG: tellurium resistance protein TerC [Elusimicrobia bacterium RIFCSPLOWO2_01_FULL_59_12]|nr:MAG: tellurium resistance protein TerC [Elusimicrobia bacterium RIFCSPLOWO2_01_FULL_59_12]
MPYWIEFNLFVLVMLALDLSVFHRKAHEVRFREAAGWSVFWIVLSLLFNVGIYVWMGKVRALEFLACYLVEKSLSVDNLFIFFILFHTFHVKAQYQHKILFWGILGALIMRGLFIAAGISLLHRFHWMIYVFGAILLLTGIKMALRKPEEETDPAANIALNFIKRHLPVSDHQDHDHFFTRIKGRWMATPLFVVLLTIEFTDVVFALDSIPAVLAFSTHSFIVYTSNVFAILGMRALYFAIAQIVPKLHYLHYGLSAIIVVVGVKMILSNVIHIPIGVSLGVTVGILVLTTAASLLRKPAS